MTNLTFEEINNIPIIKERDCRNLQSLSFKYIIRKQIAVRLICGYSMYPMRREIFSAAFITSAATSSIRSSVITACLRWR